MQRPERPNDAAIRLALLAVVSSALFSRSERLKSFISYVVERELEGSGHQLKGYTIGVDVFGRSHTFNADSDPLVRVHAGKLRKLLTAYYASEGAADEWRINIPKGTYVPVYHRAEREEKPSVVPATPALAAVPAARRTPKRSWLPRPLSSPAALLTFLPLLLFVPLTSPAMSVNLTNQSRLSATAIERNIARELPNVTVSAAPKQAKAERFAAALRAAAGHYRTIATPAQSGLWQKSPAETPLSFLITVSEQAPATGLRVEITNAASTRPLYTAVIQQDDLKDEADILFESLSFAARALTLDGAIFRYAIDQKIASNLMQCMILTDVYRHQQNRETFLEAKSCQDALSSERQTKLRFVISAGALPATFSR